MTENEKRVSKKPSWLKKANPNLPWKYKHIIQEGEHKGLEIEPYNFNTPIGMDFDKIDEAIDWIDEQMREKTKKTQVTFTEETIEKLTWQTLGDYKEFAQTLCIDDGKVFLGGKPVYGTERGVDPPIDDFIYPSGCEPGEVAGRIHSHVEEHDERPPFDKGSSNMDIFAIAKEGLNHVIGFPRLECIVSPTYDKKGYLDGVKIGCEHFEQFTEDDIKKIHTGMIIGDKEEKFDDEDITWIKGGRPPMGDMFARTGFMVRMANLKSGLEEEGFLSYDEFDVRCKRENTRRLLCDFHDETLNF